MITLVIFAAVGTRVRGLGARRGHCVDRGTGTSDVGLVHNGDLLAAEDGFRLFEGRGWSDPEELGPEIDVPDTTDNGGDVGEIRAFVAGFMLVA